MTEATYHAHTAWYVWSPMIRLQALCPQSSPACFSWLIYLSSKVLIIFPCTLLICSLTAFVYDCSSALPHPWSTNLDFWDSTVALLLPRSFPWLLLSTHSLHPKVLSSMLAMLRYNFVFMSLVLPTWDSFLPGGGGQCVLMSGAQVLRTLIDTQEALNIE